MGIPYVYRTDTMEAPQTPHSHAAKQLFLVFLGLIVVIFFTFAAMVTYYIWQQEYGDAATKKELVQTFEVSELSLLPGAKKKTTEIDTPIQEYIAPHNPQFGNTNAAVTIIAFIDFECPYCQQSFETFEKIRDQFGPAVRIVFKHFPIHAIHPKATNAAIAAQCAHDQGKFWEYYQALFTGYTLDDASLQQYAQRIGLQTTTFRTCLASQYHLSKISEDIQQGIDLGVRGTPTYVINQTRIDGGATLERWQELIVTELQQQ